MYNNTAESLELCYWETTALLERNTRKKLNLQLHRVMIAAPGVYGGKLCRYNISGANLVEYFININSDSTQNQSTRN